MQFAMQHSKSMKHHRNFEAKVITLFADISKTFKNTFDGLSSVILSNVHCLQSYTNFAVEHQLFKFQLPCSSIRGFSLQEVYALIYYMQMLLR